MGLSVSAGILAEGLSYLVPSEGDSSAVLSPQVLDLFQGLQVFQDIAMYSSFFILARGLFIS